MDYMTFINENYVAIILVAVIVLMTIIGYFADKKTNSKKPVEKSNKKEKMNKEVFEEFDTPTDLEPEVNEMESINSMDSFNEMPSVEPVSVENSFEDIPEELFEGVDYQKPVDDVQTEEVVDVPVEPIQDQIIDEVSPTEEVEPVDVTIDEVAPVEEVEHVDDTIDEVAPVEEEVVPVEDTVDEVAPVEPVSPVVDDMGDWTSIEETPDVETGVTYDEVDAPVDTVEDSEWNNIDSIPVEEDNSTDDNNITFDGVVDEDFKLPTIDKLNDELADVDSTDVDVWKF